MGGGFEVEEILALAEEVEEVALVVLDLVVGQIQEEEVELLAVESEVVFRDQEIGLELIRYNRRTK